MKVRTAARAAYTPASSRTTRTRIGTAMSLTRRFAVLTAYAARFNTGTVTAGQYLTDVLGTDEAFAAAYDSPFGKAIKKAYVAIHGDEPARIRLAAVGTRLHRKVGYLLGEPALAVATRTYPRTAALIGA